ncbi:MAG: hypothetical protein K1X57_14725 [Gemmataceae bacterium]|nr:hypothetical protein [Gemmataceae bacterium]
MNTLVRSTTLLVAYAALGCGQGPAEYHVAGTVTWNGKPLPRGQIFFDPDLRKKNDGVQGYAMVEDGRFDTRKGRATAGGPHVIRAAGFDGVAGSELPLGRPLFAEITIERDLPKQNSTIEIQLPEKKAP